MQLGRCSLVFLPGLFLRARLAALLAVEHVGAGNLVLARAHQRQLDLILNVFNMEGTATRLAPRQRGDDSLGEPRDQLADAR